jgi:hypothetical protein
VLVFQRKVEAQLQSLYIGENIAKILKMMGDERR